MNRRAFLKGIAGIAGMVAGASIPIVSDLTARFMGVHFNGHYFREGARLAITDMGPSGWIELSAPITKLTNVGPYLRIDCSDGNVFGLMGDSAETFFVKLLETKGSPARIGVSS